MFQAALRSDTCLNVSELAALPHKPEFRFNITVCAEAAGAGALLSNEPHETRLRQGSLTEGSGGLVEQGAGGTSKGPRV